MLTKRVYAKASTKAKSSKAIKKARNIDYKPTFRVRVLKNPYANAISRTLRTKMIYYETVSLNPGIATCATHVFSANGLYDPNITGTGHQPTGFDQLMAIFGEYVVVGSTIKVTFQNNQAGATTALQCGIYLSRVTSTSTTPLPYIENGNGVYTAAENSGSGSGIKVLNYSCDMSKQTSMDITKDQTYSGTASSNPSEQRYYFVWVGPLDQASDLGAATVCVEITFDVILRDRVNTDTS